jgi:hypothetical protein
MTKYMLWAWNLSEYIIVGLFIALLGAMIVNIIVTTLRRK